MRILNTAEKNAQDVSKLQSIVKKRIEKNSEIELMNKAFLRPIEICLKDYKTQGISSPASTMPFGLKQVLKVQVKDNKYTMQDFLSIKAKIKQIEDQGKIWENNFEFWKKNHCDNIMTFLMPIDNRPQIKIAICVCMYSEDKANLKKTLAGIEANIVTFAKNGVAAHEIAVFLIMDGIEAAHPTIQQFFEQKQFDNQLIFGEEINKMNLNELMNEGRVLEEDEIENINHLIFDELELEDRQARRFTARKRQYLKWKNMIKDIEMKENNKSITYAELTEEEKQFFLKIARKRYRKQFGVTEQEAKCVNREKIQSQYAYKNSISRPIILQALNQAKKFCKQYISVRQNLALLSNFRVAVQNPNFETSRTSRDQNTLHEMRQGSEQAEDTQADGNSVLYMNLFIVTRYQNKGKLASHNWFFNGFCKELKPKYAFLLDVGLSPQKQALYRMYDYMENDQKVGGVCGYMGLRIQRLDENQQVHSDYLDCISSTALRFVDIQKAQQFEYHFAHLVDKPFQSSFDFIHVLPGAFSGYRMQAIAGTSEKQSQVLKEYFKSIEERSQEYKAQIYTPLQTFCKVVLPDLIYQCCYKIDKNSYEQLLYDQNVYLAEDRTLCMGIHQNGYKLKYLPDAYAWVDPIKTLHGILGQRKRWINGSFFAFAKVKSTLNQSSNCQLGLKIQILYLTLMNQLAYISPALFMYTIHIAMYTLQSNVIVAVLQNLSILPQDSSVTAVETAGVFVYTMDFIYVMIFLGMVFYSMHLTNKDNRFRTFFYGVSTIYGIFSLAVFGVLLYDLISGLAGTKNTFLLQNQWFINAIPGGQATIDSIRYIMLGIISLYIIPILVSLIFCKFSYILDILLSTLSFVFYTPTYLNILNIYALCRIDDISWGTKGLDSGSNRKKQMLEDWKKVKIVHVCKFVLYNCIVGFLLLVFGNDYVVRFFLTLSIMIILGLTLGLKVIMSVVYLVKYRLTSSNSKSIQVNTSTVKDPVKIHYAEIRKSLYDEIDETISQIYTKSKNNNEGQQLGIEYLSMVITNSMVCKNSFKFSKRIKQNLQSLQESLSIRNSKNISRIQAMNQSQRANRLPNQQPNQQANQPQQNNTRQNQQIIFNNRQQVYRQPQIMRPQRARLSQIADQQPISTEQIRLQGSQIQNTSLEPLNEIQVNRNFRRNGII